MTTWVWIGVGEVTTSLLSAGLGRAAGIRSVIYKSPSRSFSMRASQWLTDSNTLVLENPQDLARASVVISAVTPGAAEAVAEQVAPYLSPDCFYLDMNSIAVPTVLRIAKSVEDHGARLVDAAIMGPVPVLGLDVPILLSGTSAAEWHRTAKELGLNTRVVSANPGDASATKMLWSVITKGTIGLYVEALVSAYRMGLLPELTQLLAREYGNTGSEEMVIRFLRSTSVNGQRRIDEMEQVRLTLDAVSVPAWTVQATAQWIQQLASMQVPGDAHTVEEVAAAISHELTVGQVQDSSNGNNKVLAP